MTESRNRVLRLFEGGEPSTADVVAAVEGDVALAVTVLRLANQVEGPTRGRVESAVKGVEVLQPRDDPLDRQPRAHIRLLRAHRRLADDPRALPPPRRRDPARRRPARARDRLRAPRPADGHLAAARHRQAGAGSRLSRLSAPGPRRGAHAGGAARSASAASSASTTRWSAACSPGAGGCRKAIAQVIERHHADDGRGRGRDRAPGRHARPLRRWAAR